MCQNANWEASVLQELFCQDYSATDLSTDLAAHSLLLACLLKPMEMKMDSGGTRITDCKASKNVQMKEIILFQLQTFTVFSQIGHDLVRTVMSKLPPARPYKFPQYAWKPAFLYCPAKW